MIPTQTNMQNFCSQNATCMYNKHNAFFGLTLQGNNLTNECPYLRKEYYALTHVDRGQPSPAGEVLYSLNTHTVARHLIPGPEPHSIR